MSIAYFISDVHLGELPKEQEINRVNHFLHFLMKIEQSAECIFIVGDLFDFWFEYKYVIPKKYFNLLTQLARLRQKNIEIHYLTGNHDFYLGRFFEEELGIKTYKGDWQGTIDNKRFYLYHGDGIAKRDSGYRLLKKIIRSPISIKLYRLIHPDIGIPFARFVSGSSRKYTNNINLRDYNDYIEFAKKRFDEGFDYVIMGHRHDPVVHEENGKKYVNLGDWLTNFSYGVFDGNDLKIEFINKKGHLDTP
jgi:UDP-2,3-diacylglucosamine hydrolase